MNLKEFAQKYEPQRMKNITDLELVRADIEIHEEDRKDQNNENYHVIFVVKDGEEYRIPPSVFTQIKAIIESKPDVTAFKVTKTGEGKATKYQVINL